MRYMCCLLIGFCISMYSNAQLKKTIDSKIEKVTVFLEGAQVQRTAKASLAPGKHELVFSGISPAIDKQSIQVKADGNITVLSVIHQQNFLKEQEKQQEISQAELQKDALRDKISLQKNILNVYKQEESLLIKNQEVGGANGLKAIDLKEAADFQRLRLTEVYQKQMETEKMIKKLEADVLKLNKQLTELNQQTDISTSEIYVTAVTKETITTGFTITYLIRQAGWYPTYDVRVKDISSPINLQYKANVFQSSGEDWKDVKMLLSTGNPNDNGTRPVINPWYLKYNYATQPINLGSMNKIQSSYGPGSVSGRITNEKGEPVPGASIVVKGTSTGITADANGFFNIRMPANSSTLSISSIGMENQELQITGGYANVVLKEHTQQLEEVVVTGYGLAGSVAGIQANSDDNRENPARSFKKLRSPVAINTTTVYQPTTTIYEIDDPYTILNDGKTYMVEIDGYEINAQYEYYAAPKVEPDVFLTAKIADWQELNLLPGEANLFFEGTFLGKSALDIINAGDTLNISLGKDKGVVIKRTLMKEFSSKKFMGSNKTDTRQYEILVRNNKQQPISIIIEDQFPISTQKEIEVQDREYPMAKLDTDTQKLTWQFSVEPKKETKLKYKYEVKYPKEKILQLD